MLNLALEWHTKVSSDLLLPPPQPSPGALLSLEDVQAADTGQSDGMCLSKRRRLTFPLI